MQPSQRFCLNGLLICCLFICGVLQAQQTTATFKIINNKNEPVPFATVSVISIPDTINKQQMLADSAGTAVFNLLQSKPYSVQVTSVNYELFKKNISVKGDNPVFTLTLESGAKTLNTVVVTSSRPVMRQEDDKTIVEPENLAASSTNAYEIMEKIPGLFVDQDGNIYLSSTTPATVYINGREQKMSTTDIATMLKSLPPGAIASIEILRTPSAKYDASGSGGIVNVILKKGVRIGLTGSVNMGLNQGKYGNQFVGINLNNSNGKVTTYLNIQYSHRGNYERINTDRLFAPDSLLRQTAFTKYPASTNYIGYGLSYPLNKQWDFSYDGRVSINNTNTRSTNQSELMKVSAGNVFANRTANVHSTGFAYNIAQSVSLKYKLDSLGSEWTTDLSFNFAPNNTDQLFTGGDGTLKNDLHFISAQSNLQKKFLKKLTLETGIKTTNVGFDNKTNYFIQSGSTRVKDALRTGAYQYSENINSIFLQLSKTLSSITVKAGARAENTNMKGVQLVPVDTSFNIHRTDLFPYVYISRNLMKIAGYDLRAYLVYRRTISRPAYEYLNPFPRYVDPYLFEVGNPSLKPQFTKNYEANISVDERPVFALGVNDTKDIFNQVVYQTDSSKAIAYRTYDNLGSNKETYFRILGAIPQGKRYFFVAGAQYNHNFYNGLYEGKPLSFNRGSWSVFTYQTFKITKLTQLTLNGFARFNGQQQFYELTTFGALNMSLTQQFFNKKLVATLSATDILFTNNNHFILQQGSVAASGYREGDTRRFGLNLRYNFGFRKKEENNLFNIESPDKSN